jgi:thiamine kinase-like enzyme
MGATLCKVFAEYTELTEEEDREREYKRIMRKKKKKHRDKLFLSSQQTISIPVRKITTTEFGKQSNP